LDNPPTPHKGAMDGVAHLPLPISDGERLRRNALPAAFFFYKKRKRRRLGAGGWGLGLLPVRGKGTLRRG